MSHTRNDSKDSDASETVSDAESIISFSEGVLRTMEDERFSTQRYVDEANKIIEALAEKKKLIETPKCVDDLDASLVLKAMLTYSRETGGESSERYTACAICSCKEVHEQVELARTWFMYLLWPFKAGSHKDEDLVSEQATPTIEDTIGTIVSARRDRRSGFRKDVAERDGHRCIVTGLWDGDHRPAGSNQMMTTLIACHILKRAVGVFGLDRAHSAAATWNIIRHYSGMSEQTIRGMETLIDDPSNGFMLQHDIHVNFDKLKWYLVPKPESDNEYTIEEVRGGPWVAPEHIGKSIKFQNRAAARNDLPLPNPIFIALHAGIARVLHMSGAAEVLDQIIDRYDKEGGSSGLRKHGEGTVDQISSMISALHIMDATPMIS